MARNDTPATAPEAEKLPESPTDMVAALRRQNDPLASRAADMLEAAGKHIEGLQDRHNAELEELLSDQGLPREGAAITAPPAPHESGSSLLTPPDAAFQHPESARAHARRLIMLSKDFAERSKAVAVDGAEGTFLRHLREHH